MKNFKFLVVAAMATGVLNSCAPKQDGFVAEPSENFFLYANGEWLRNNPIPADKSRLGRFDVLAEESQERIKGIIEEAAKENGEQGSASQKIGDLYALGMDTVTRNKQGYEALKPIFVTIDAMDDVEALPGVIAQLNLVGVWPMMYFGAQSDPDNSDMNISGLYQTGLGLPDRDYYFDDSERAAALRSGYKQLLSNFFALIDESDCDERAEAVFNFEKTIAEPMLTRVERRNPHVTTNKREAANLVKQFPAFDWNMYFNTLNVKPTIVNVSSLKYFEQLGGMVNSTDLNVVKDYLKMLVVREFADYLTSDFVNADFEFYGKTLSGLQEQRPLWKRTVNVVDGVLGEQIGQLFVKKYFPESYKMRMVELIENLRTSFSQRIDSLEWMCDETKAKAHEKLATITVKVGYPDVWRDYSKLNIDKNLTFAENIMAASRFEVERDFADIDKAVDKSRWHMTPQTVNAYYNPTVNEIVFPAGILQPPFFFGEGDDATNYGGIGVVIGHEMTHGFDDQGRNFDKDGNLKDWWTPADAEKFGAITGKLVEHFNGLQAIDSVFCNGELTLGENIADNGGLNISYQALRNANAGKADPMTDGQTMDERFILSYAHIWACNVRDEYVQNQVKTDPHSPANLRVNGQMMLFDLFYKTYNIPDSSAMWLPEEKRIVVW